MTSSKRLEQKVAIVTGSSRGIGAEVVKQMMQEGALVVSNSRRPIPSSHVLPGAVHCEGDMTSRQDRTRLIQFTKELYGRLDILVCSVGFSSPYVRGNGLNETEENWRLRFETNFWSAVNLIDEALPLLTSTSGSIVCISSICGLEYIHGAPLSYAVSKASVNAYVRLYSHHIAKHGVRLNAVAPGNVLFPGSVWHNKLNNDSLNVMQYVNSEVPLGRFATLEDISEAVVWLASPKSSFCSGCIMVVDGGQQKKC